jgi:hypothetical protein
MWNKVASKGMWSSQFKDKSMGEVAPPVRCSQVKYEIGNDVESVGKELG